MTVIDKNNLENVVAVDQSINGIKRATQQRLQYIELMAYYTGVVTRSDIAKAFGISDAAATKDLKFYNQIAPDNLIYKHNVFGFVPSTQFEEIFTDLEPAQVLPMIAANLPFIGQSIEQNLLYGVNTEELPLPQRLPDKKVVAHVIRAIKQKTKLSLVYSSLSDRNSSEARIIEPHSLVNTGLRWHVRAYSEDTYDFRDFVLSRVQHAQQLSDKAESNPEYDDDWMEPINLQLTPHPKLSDDRRQILMTDYAAKDDVIEFTVRRALLAYVLQRLSVDTTEDHSLNPNAYQLIMMNRDEIEPFAGWAFL
ncbi:MAG: WYL domain-containing protein [Gammaproteobacteria bacterium]|nr:WYL domain-containing protein [Gammaproteobacteria bacterium]